VDTKRTIRKILIVAMWLTIGGGMVTLLAAAMRQQKSEKCAGHNITIKGESDKLFVDEKEVMSILAKEAGGNLKGKKRASFDLMKMEQLLEKNVWIRDAELYFDNKDMLQVNITERTPVARIFTLGNKTWYIDREEIQMPLSDKVAANVPVFTGFPVKKVVSKRDKQLLHEIRMMAEHINASPFWSSQVAQIDITTERQFELVPVAGNHIVKLGDAADFETKFNRLFIFYKNVLAKSGLDKYKTIDVQYAGQVIGVKGYASKVDSIQLRRNVEKMLQAARQMQNDTLIPVAPVIAAPSIEASISNEPIPESDLPATTLNRPSQQRVNNPNPVKPSLPQRQPAQQDMSQPRSPKAVMPSRQ